MKRYMRLIIIFYTLFTVNAVWGQTTLTAPGYDETDLNGEYILQESIDTKGGTKRYRITSGRTVVIDLNGYTIDATGKEKALFNIADGTLTIKDTSEGKTGTIKGTRKTCIYIQPGSGKYGTVNLEGGTITDCQPSDGEGGAVEINVRGTFNMNGGTITGCRASQGAGVYVKDGTFNMTGGTITDNKVFSVNDYGTSWQEPTGDNLPVGVPSEIEYKGATNSIGSHWEYKGGGVYVERGTFTMEGGTISRNVSINGGGVYVTSAGNFSFKGGTIENNYATSAGFNHGNGGGIYLSSGATFVLEGSASEILNVTGNRATRFGGGIYVNNSDVTLNYCNLNGNYASSGGGLAQEGSTSTIEISNCSVQSNHAKVVKGSTSSDNGGGGMYILNEKATFTVTDSNINENVSRLSGGGIYMKGGTFKIDGTTSLNGNTAIENDGGGIYLGGNGSFNVLATGSMIVGSESKPNSASNGNGGGIFCAGTFSVTSGGQANVSYNQAKNGGGICVNNGEVTFPANSPGKENIVSHNIAESLGGGLYVYNTGTAKQATFNGGTFAYNTAALGGGACANGNIDLTIASSFESNTAKNGGAIYMMNGVTMDFGAGLIRTNRAVKNTVEDYHATAKGASYNNGVVKCNGKEIYGFGGGVFMDKNTTLTFGDVVNLGIYNNSADWGADDIFVNGSTTKVTLPYVKDMELTGFVVPNDLYWIEDYPASDSNYPRISKVDDTKAIRYDDALNTELPLGTIVNPTNETSSYQLIDQYLCLTLGYEMAFVSLEKIGLRENDDVTFTISYKTPGGAYVEFRKVIFTGNAGSTPISKVIAIPSGEWKVEESGWGWKYNAPTFKDGNGNSLSFPVLINRSSNKIIKVFNTLDPKYMNIQEFEHRKRNILRPNKVVTQ